MDKITFKCPCCMHEVCIPIEYAGQKRRCPKCREVVQIPMANGKSLEPGEPESRPPAQIPSRKSPGLAPTKTPGLSPGGSPRQEGVPKSPPSGISPSPSDTFAPRAGAESPTPPGSMEGYPVEEEPLRARARARSSRYSLRSQSVGDLINTIIHLVFSEHLLHFLVIMLIGQIPMFLLQVEAFQMLCIKHPVVFVIAFIAFSMMCMGAITAAVASAYLGERASIPDCFQSGFRSILPIFVFMLVCFLVAVGFIIGAMVLTFILAALGRQFGAILALAIIMIAGIRLCLSISVAIPAIVVERIGGLAGFRRSRQLTEGSLWRIFATYFVLLLPFIIVMALLAAEPSHKDPLHNEPSTIEEPSPMEPSPFEPPRESFPMGSSPIGQNSIGLWLLNLLVTLCGSIAGSVASVAIYFDLRASKESFGLEELAKVFD